MGNKISLESNSFSLEIDQLVEKNLVEEANLKYVEYIAKMDQQENKQLKADIYASYAFFLFSIQKYKGFFEMLRKAQNNGYSDCTIENFIMEAFIEPNIDEFRTIYDANKEYLISNGYLNSAVIMDFQELPYWLLPSGTENEYYLYDKERRLLLEQISLNNQPNAKTLCESEELADYLMLENGDWESIFACTSQMKKQNKKAYIVIDSVGKFYSCLQGALLNADVFSNVLIFESLYEMGNYFKYTSEYLPRNIINMVDNSQRALNYLSVIHNYRINNKKCARNNILLSICIPSFNRGNRAYENIIHLLQSRYDVEIEFVLSNNGTKNDTKKYYEDIKELDDVRVKYFAFEENNGFALNTCKVCELAQGEYILLISDEDMVDLDVLDKIMNELIKNKDSLAIMKTSSTTQNKFDVKVANPGEEAMLTFMLTSNYVSGLIMNNKILKKYNGIQYVKENLDNSVCYNYPHMYWELLLSQYGNVHGTNLILIQEGKPEKSDVESVEFSNNKIEMPYFSTIEGRIEQHRGFYHIFKTLDVCKEDSKLFREMYIRLCSKTLFLAQLSIMFYYKKTNMNTLVMLDQVYEICISKEFFDCDNKTYKKDVGVIGKHYEYYKKQI